jgi:CTP:molybdopterin cytidylyltransferase MocA
LNISATILAAGSSERMEEANKLLLPYRSEAMGNQMKRLWLK